MDRSSPAIAVLKNCWAVRLTFKKNTSMFLVKLDNPDNATLVASQINNRLPNTHNAVALTREEVMQAELTRWIDSDPIGFRIYPRCHRLLYRRLPLSFSWVLSNDVTQPTARIRATLKAMG